VVYYYIEEHICKSTQEGEIMSTVRWGLLSTANINKALIPAIRESKRSQLVAVASRTLERAQAYANEWNIPQAFGSYPEMLTSGTVDAVYIGLPNHLHAEWTVKSVEAGVHVLCEKPFATSTAEVDTVIAARESSGVVVAEGFMYRHHPQTKIVKDWIDQGRLGEILVIRGAFHFFLGENQRHPESLNVRLVPEYGGGCLWDVGIYPVSYAQFLLGSPPAWVFGSQITGPTGIDEVFTGQMGYKMKDGREVLAQFVCSFNSPYHTFMEIIGSAGRLFISRPFNRMDKGGVVRYWNPQEQANDLRIPTKSLFLGEVEDLESAILDNAPTLIDLIESRNHILTAQALYQSAGTGQVIHLDEFIPEL
jgi:predicted dehydrogenase